jgi:protein-L-isoaspartate O-methyltransferase
MQNSSAPKLSPNEAIVDIIHRATADKSNPAKTINSILYMVASWRANALAHDRLDIAQGRVMSGPFQGMNFYFNDTLGCYAPKLIGVYEMEMHGFVREAIAKQYEAVINIGCAEGYYAVGFATTMPNSIIHAHDIDEKLQAVTMRVAQKNNVQDRVKIGGLFDGSRFAEFKGKRTLVFCDIEGAERELIDPVKYPELLNMDILLECHECFIPELRKVFIERFSKTHDITWAEPDLRWGKFNLNMPGLDDLDLCLLSYENRAGATPWGYFKKK